MSANESQYEFMSVKAIRGTEARSIEKWQKLGWELQGQEPGTFRTELTFRRIKPRTPLAYVLALATSFRGLGTKTQLSLLAIPVVLVAGGVYLGVRNAGESPKPTAATTAMAITPSPSRPTTRDSPTAEVLTPKNSKDLKALLTEPDECGDAIAAFASKYGGQTIEFHGTIAAVDKHANRKTRYDVLVVPGDRPTSGVGPYFQFRDVNLSIDLRLPGFADVGDRLDVVAQVFSYESTSCIFRLTPVTTKLR